MRKRKGFTLIELMVVVLIVAVLAAVLIPMITARVEAAKWSEGKAGAGTIATAIRAYAAEKGNDGDYDNLTVADLFKDVELDGKYFDIDSYEIGDDLDYDEDTAILTYTITVTGDTDWKIGEVTLDETGAWTETENE